MVKMSYKELVIPLFHICKNSMKLGIFPDEMKQEAETALNLKCDFRTMRKLITIAK